MPISLEVNEELLNSSQLAKMVIFSKIKLVNLTVTARLKNKKLASNISQLNLLLVSKNIDINIELYGKVMIKANRRTFNLIVAINKYKETFTFEKNYLLIKIIIIENYKMKIITKSTTYIKLA